MHKSRFVFCRAFKILEKKFFFPCFIFVKSLIQIIVYLFWRTFLNYPPGPWYKLRFEDTWDLSNKPLSFLEDLKQDYGNVASVRVGSYPAVVVSDYDSIRKLLLDSRSTGKPNCVGFKECRLWNGRTTGIFGMQSEDYIAHKVFLNDCLSKKGNRKYEMEIAFKIEARLLVNKLATEMDIDQFESTDFVRDAVINALWVLVTGESFFLHEEDKEELSYLLSTHVQALNRSPSIFYHPWKKEYSRNFNGLKKYKDTFQDVKDFMSRTVQRYSDEAADNTQGLDSKPHCLIKSYLEQLEIHRNDPNSIFYENIGRENLIATMSDILIHGVEVVTSTLRWAILYMILHPSTQENLYDEICKTYRGCVPNLAARERMPYTRAFISEVQRCASIIPVTPAHKTTDAIQLGLYRIPKNTLIFANLHSAQKDEDQWGHDVQTFHPERFLSFKESVSNESNNEISDQIVYKTLPGFLSFSTGKRSCIGRRIAQDQIFLFLVFLVQAFQFLPDLEIQTRQELVDSQYCEERMFLLTPRPFTFLIERRGDYGVTKL